MRKGNGQSLTEPQLAHVQRNAGFGGSYARSEEMIEEDDDSLRERSMMNKSSMKAERNKMESECSTTT